jgi:hypothetical protein
MTAGMVRTEKSGIFARQNNCSGWKQKLRARMGALHPYMGTCGRGWNVKDQEDASWGRGRWILRKDE